MTNLTDKTCPVGARGTHVSLTRRANAGRKEYNLHWNENNTLEQMQDIETMKNTLKKMMDIEVWGLGLFSEKSCANLIPNYAGRKIIYWENES